jgi:type II secretory pathway component PulF
MQTTTTTTFDWQKIADWVKQNWVLVLVGIIVLVIVLRLLRGRPRAVIY